MLKVPVALRELKILQESVLCFFEKIEANREKAVYFNGAMVKIYSRHKNNPN